MEWPPVTRLTSFCHGQPNCKIGFKAGTSRKTICRVWTEREPIPRPERGLEWRGRYAMEDKRLCNSSFPTMTFMSTTPFQCRLASAQAHLTIRAAHPLLMKPVAQLQLAFLNSLALQCSGTSSPRFHSQLPHYPWESCFNLSMLRRAGSSPRGT